ncbi:MAG: molybdenum cofactor guanylyltransferase [Desulfobacterales bacterium]|nr:molybdenum cofactor guanylyltransferase [Desulfobacterales bacterium]
MICSCTGVILAGGLSSRFSGRDKAFLPIGGQRIIDRMYSVFKNLFEEIILVTNDPLQYLEWDFKIVTDIFPIRSSLTGIHAGLYFSTNPYAFIAACDAPFLKREVIEAIANQNDPRFDVVIPETSKGLEPLCAVYSKRCLSPIERQLAVQDFKIRRFFPKNRVKKISEQLLRQKDPTLLSFFNINTPLELARAEEIISTRGNDIKKDHV